MIEAMNTSKMECIKVWRRGNLRLTIWDTGKRGYYGEKSRLAYRFRQKGKLLFEGDDFYPSLLYADDSMQTMYSLLGFLTVRRGDTDDEYFVTYTKCQIAWCDSQECEELSYFVTYMEEKQDKNRQ